MFGDLTYKQDLMDHFVSLQPFYASLGHNSQLVLNCQIEAGAYRWESVRKDIPENVIPRQQTAPGIKDKLSESSILSHKDMDCVTNNCPVQWQWWIH